MEEDQIENHPAEEGDQAVLNGLLTGLLAGSGQQPPLQPSLESTSNINEFIEGLRCLLDSHSVRVPLQVPEPERAPKASQEDFQDVADSLLAELLQSNDKPVEESPVDELPSPETPIEELKGEREPRLSHPGTALSLLGLASSFGDTEPSFEDDAIDRLASARPAGPFEVLLDAIDSELGPRPQFHTAHTTHSVPESARGERFVTFELADDWYALPLERVLETDRPAKHTFVPGMPQYFLGVVNLRGEILPLIDLRILFGIEDAPFEGRMLIIEDPATKQRYAFRVDRLAGIVSIPQEEIGQPLPPEDELEELDEEDEEAPEPAVASRIAHLLRGVAFPGTQSVHILETDRLLAVATGCESLV